MISLRILKYSNRVANKASAPQFKRNSPPFSFFAARWSSKVRTKSTNTNSGALKGKISRETEEGLQFLSERANKLGFRLSLEERNLILEEAKGCGGRMSRKEWEALVTRKSLEEQEVMTLSSYLAKSHDLHLGQAALKWLSRLGVAFFAFTGSNTAGESGMHVLGSVIVGNITGLGGGTLNNLITGVTPVGWVKDPKFLAITTAASLAGFYVWPVMERIYKARGGGVGGGGVGGGGSGDHHVRLLRYSMESVALGSLAVIGAQQGIVRGLHPGISCVLGVTIAFGGVVRDLMCNRNLTLGASSGCQSYGVASLAGASVYVGLRQLHVWNCAGNTVKLVKGGIPIGLRIAMGFGTVFAVRAYGWYVKEGGDGGGHGERKLLLTMDENADAIWKMIEGGDGGSKVKKEQCE